MLIEMLRPSWGSLPAAFQGARAHRIGVNPERPPLDLLAHMRAAVKANGGGAIWNVACQSDHGMLGPLPDIL